MGNRRGLIAVGAAAAATGPAMDALAAAAGADAEELEAVSLHYMHYNFARSHQTLTKQAGTLTTPAMAAGITDHVWTLTEIAALLDV